jgi:hypothetical protein
MKGRGDVFNFKRYLGAKKAIKRMGGGENPIRVE